MPASQTMLEALLVKTRETQSVLRQGSENLARRLFHLHKSTDSTNCLNAVISRHPLELLKLLDEMAADEPQTKDAFASNLFNRFDELFIEGDTRFLGASFSPALVTANRQSNLLEEAQFLSIVWANRDGLVSLYGRRAGEARWKKRELKKNDPDSYVIGDLPDIAAQHFNCTQETLKINATIYYTANSPLPVLPYAHVLNDIRLHLNPVWGTSFDLCWEHLEISVPVGNTRFIVRRLPSLGLGFNLKKATGIDNPSLLKRILLSNDDNIADQLGLSTSPIITAEEIRLHLAGMFEGVKRLFPKNAPMYLDGWFNANQFRSVLEEAGHASFLPAQANVITPWHRVLMESYENE